MDFAPIRRAPRHEGQPTTAYVLLRHKQAAGQPGTTHYLTNASSNYEHLQARCIMGMFTTRPGAGRASAETAPRDGESGPNYATRASADTAHVGRNCASRLSQGRNCAFTVT
jgi:hypothetical protein